MTLEDEWSFVVAIRASLDGRTLTLTVADTGAGASQALLENSPGSGLTRLRARLRALYGDAAELGLAAGATGVTATLRVPQLEDDA